MVSPLATGGQVERAGEVGGGPPPVAKGTELAIWLGPAPGLLAAAARLAARPGNRELALGSRRGLAFR